MSGRLTEAELDDLRERLFRGRVDPYGAASRLLDHIAALEARLAALERVVEAACHVWWEVENEGSIDHLSGYHRALMCALDTYAAAKEGA